MCLKNSYTSNIGSDSKLCKIKLKQAGGTAPQAYLTGGSCESRIFGMRVCDDWIGKNSPYWYSAFLSHERVRPSLRVCAR